MRRELELKVELTPPDIARLKRVVSLPNISVSAPTCTKLRSIYFDTLDHDLQAAGISLRLRKSEGGWVQTVKADQHVVDGASNPIEQETLLVRNQPEIARIANDKLNREVRHAVKRSALNPVFETNVQRTTRKITAKDGELELAVDSGEVCAGSARRPLHEVELELKKGSVEALLFVADKLLSDYAVKFSRHSKAERGYRLVNGKSVDHPEPERAKLPSLRRKDSGRAAMSTILDRAVRQITVNRAALLDTDDPNAAHQLRIGLRRLRSALRALRPLADGSSLRAFERAAQELGRCVGTLRDADVLILNIHAPIEAVAPDKTGFDALKQALAQNRVACRDEVRAALRGPAWNRLQIYLALWPRTLEDNASLDRSIVPLARKILQKAWKKAATIGSNLERLDPERRHELRKALKTFRYQAEMFEPLFGKNKTEHFIKLLKELQDVFGYVNDARLAGNLFSIQKKRNAGEDAARAAGYAIGQRELEAKQAWARAEKLWRKLERSPCFWR